MIGLAEKPEAIERVLRMTRSVAKGPAPLIPNRIDDRHANDRFQLLELPHDDRPVRPRTGPGHVEMIPACGGWIA